MTASNLEISSTKIWYWIDVLLFNFSNSGLSNQSLWFKMLSILCFSNSGNENCWIDLNDIDLEDDFHWSNGTPILLTDTRLIVPGTERIMIVLCWRAIIIMEVLRATSVILGRTSFTRSPPQSQITLTIRPAMEFWECLLTTSVALFRWLHLHQVLI